MGAGAQRGCRVSSFGIPLNFENQGPEQPDLIGPISSGSLDKMTTGSFFQPKLFYDSKKRTSSVSFLLLLLIYALLLRLPMETRLVSADASLKGN